MIRLWHIYSRNVIYISDKLQLQLEVGLVRAYRTITNLISLFFSLQCSAWTLPWAYSRPASILANSTIR